MAGIFVVSEAWACVPSVLALEIPTRGSRDAND
jgi:hypothetical protein